MEEPQNITGAAEKPTVQAMAEEIIPGVQKLPVAALSDWVMLLQGPAPPLFAAQSKFDQEFKRLFRLVTVVLLMMGAVVTAFSLGLGAAGKNWQQFASNSSYLFLILVVGAVVAVPYAFVLAPLLRIKITFAQTFFTVLLLGLPWLPLIALIWAVGKVWTSGLAGLTIPIFLYIIGIVPLLNFSKGVAIVSGCGRLRVLLSLLIPTLLAVVFFVANFVL